MPGASNLVSIDLIRLIMARSDDYRTRAEECRARAETSFTPEAWLKLAATWLALIPVSREAASERSKAKQPVGADGENKLEIGSTPHFIAAGGKPSPITQVDPTTARAAQPGGVDALDVGLVNVDRSAAPHSR
jgi:hypothetical protein